MMYQSAGLQSEAPKAKPFLGAFAEDIIADIKSKRILPPGDSTFKGLEGSGGLTIDDRQEYYT